jgi:glycosyltransferase involved in cell wall biosynthesis
MRVLHVINSLAPGGAERLLADLLPGLSARGVEVSLFVLDARGDAFSAQLSAAGVPVSFARPAGASPYSPIRALDVAHAVRETRPDIVHAHLAPSLHWCAAAAKGTVLISTEHASANRRMRAPLFRNLERTVYRHCERTICVSADTAAALVTWLGLPLEHFPVIANGVPLERFSGGVVPAADVAAWKHGRRAIAMTARLVPEKGHAVALEALEKLPANHCLVFAGDGAERGRLEAFARELGLGDRCLFLGSRSDVPSVLAACDMYLQSSLVEGFGIAALEAMASGLPVVASEAPGLGDLVRGAGLLFASGNAAACAAAILRTSEEAERLAAAGKRRAAEYSIERCVERYFELYAQCFPARQ